MKAYTESMANPEHEAMQEQANKDGNKKAERSTNAGFVSFGLGYQECR